MPLLWRRRRDADRYLQTTSFARRELEKKRQANGRVNRHERPRRIQKNTARAYDAGGARAKEGRKREKIKPTKKRRNKRARERKPEWGSSLWRVQRIVFEEGKRV